MVEEIYIDNLECPHCNWDYLNESWSIEIDQDGERVTGVTCQNCGKEFYVHTELSVSVKKEK